MQGRQLLHHKWLDNSIEIEKARIELLVQGLIILHLGAHPCTLHVAHYLPLFCEPCLTHQRVTTCIIYHSSTHMFVTYQV